MAKRRTKNVDAMIEQLEARLFRTANALQRYKAAKRRAEAKKQKEREALRKPKPVTIKPPKPPKPVETKPPRLTRLEKPKPGIVELYDPEPPTL